MALQSVTPLLPANVQAISVRPAAPQGNPNYVASTAQNPPAAAQSTPVAAAAGLAQIGTVSGPTENRSARREELDRALDDVRKAVEPVARNLLFSIDDDSGRTIVKVVDNATKEVIRQIPSEEILSIAKALDRLKGLLIKQEA